MGNDTKVWLLYEDFVVKLVVVTILYCAVLMLIDDSLYRMARIILCFNSLCARQVPRIPQCGQSH